MQKWTAIWIMTVPCLLTIGCSSTPRPTATVDPTLRALDDMEATSDAISAPIQSALMSVEGIGEIKAISSLVLSDGVSVNVDIVSDLATADEALMERIRAALPTDSNVTQLRVNVTSSSDVSHGASWLWEGSAWSFSEY